MRTMSRILAAVLVAVFALVAPGAARADVITGRPVRIMPLGDSITWGAGSTTTSSYRADLWKRLVGGAGLAVDLVGSGQSGSLPDTDNEGHSGWRIEQITASIDGWLATSRPDVVLLHIGTNDMNQNFDVAGAPGRLGTLLDHIHAGAPSAVVLVAQIVPALDATINARINTFNAAVPSVLSGRAYTRLVDLNSTITNADLNDTLHPNDGGYTKMADLWYAALEGVLGGGRDWPLARTGLEPGETAPTWTDTVDASSNVGGYNANLTKMETGPRAETARGGANALMYSGNDLSATGSYSYMKVFDTHLRLAANSVLTYWIYPQQANGTYVAIDLRFTDGSSLRDSGATDQYGVRAHPQFQGQGGHLVLNQWNLVRVNLSALAGRTVDRVHLGYDQPAGTGVFRGYVDDLAVSDSTREAAAPAAAVNLALEHPASASAACVAAEDAAKAIDGTTGNNSKWCTGVSDASWQVDLGAPAAVRTVIVRHASSGGERLAWNTRAYHVDSSVDGTTWATFATVTGNADGVTATTAGPVSARYVRVVVDAGQQDGVVGTRIYEVEVFGA
ncbi:GDSL-type esterase/lipase family protein [Actinoplanes sp. NPDC049265]|uniref:GDSL-type esterase/lipase family protein n=1 Tax=Actinoplanes sp. NPDC049265 TaxID=3363902 RepID=UPI00371E4D52